MPAATPPLPPPLLVERYDLALPRVPDAPRPVRIAHISDLHVRARRTPKPVRALLEAMPRLEADLVCLTGDYMDDPGDEPAALAVLAELAARTPENLPILGVFGNHDSPPFTEQARRIERIAWLDAQVQHFPGLGLTVAGAGFPEDLPRTALALAGPQTQAFTILLAHYPTEIVPAASLGIPLVLSGHTHGGQVRLSRRYAPHTSSDLPGDLAAGVLRLGHTRCCISRGVGYGFAPVRLNCPPQLAVYTLIEGAADAPATKIVAEQRW